MNAHYQGINNRLSSPCTCRCTAHAAAVLHKLHMLAVASLLLVQGSLLHAEPPPCQWHSSSSAAEVLVVGVQELELCRELAPSKEAAVERALRCCCAVGIRKLEVHKALQGVRQRRSSSQTLACYTAFPALEPASCCIHAVQLHAAASCELGRKFSRQARRLCLQHNTPTAAHSLVSWTHALTGHMLRQMTHSCSHACC